MQIVSNPSGVKSVQRGTTTVSSGQAVTVNISSVNLAKTFLRSSYQAAGVTQDFVSVRLTSATQLYIVRSTASGSAYVDWEVVENA